MKKSLMNAWIKALTSGDYAQGEGHFESTDVTEAIKNLGGGVIETISTATTTHCCLGVLARVIKDDARLAEQYPTVAAHDMNASSEFDNDELQELGFDQRAQQVLITANDNKGEGSFELISKLIPNLIPSTYGE